MVQLGHRMSATTEKIKVVFNSGAIRTLRVCDRYENGIVLVRFAGTYMRVKRFMHYYVTTLELSVQQRNVIFGGTT